MRVQIFSLAHPRSSPGGTERASHSLYRRLQGDRRVEAVSFAIPVGIEECAAPKVEDDALLVGVPDTHRFTFSTKNRTKLSAQIAQVVDRFRPDVIHLHHFLGWGVEAIEIIASLGVPVVLTVHEYALICANFGQLFTTAGELCAGSAPEKCHQCFPSVPPELFLARAAHLRRAVSFAEVVITPSAFARDRLIDWGIPPHQARVIENLLPADLLQAAVALKPIALRTRGATVVGYFGQLTPFKGVDVLVRAASALGDIENLEVRIFGENRAYRDAPFQEEIDTLMGQGATARIVRFEGAYDNADVLRLMAACDYIVVPSIWWENSPLVIREAKLAGCGVICSGIGGMKEKTLPSTDCHFPPGDHDALAVLLRRIAATPRDNPPLRAERIRNVVRGDAIAYEHHVSAYYSAIAVAARSRSGRAAIETR